MPAQYLDTDRSPGSDPIRTQPGPPIPTPTETSTPTETPIRPDPTSIAPQTHTSDPPGALICFNGVGSM
jgi:hypothetical protein